MNRNRMALTLVITVCLGFAGDVFAQTSQDSANATLAFDKLKTLAGRWEATTDKGKVSATFQLVSGGTALLEHFSMPGEPEMVTMYYLDGDRLLLTHYCKVGNQPRMQASAFDPQSSAIAFHFLDATNMPNSDAGHMHQVVIRLSSPTEATEDWTFYKDGKPGFTVPISYHRID